MSKILLRHTLTKKKLLTFLILYLYTFSLYEIASLIIVRVIMVFTVFRLLTDFVCLYNYEFGLSLCKIVRSSVILLLPLFVLFLLAIALSDLLRFHGFPMSRLTYILGFSVRLFQPVYSV
jgi:hypothetical protein